jgi:hypothetical protein
MNFTRIDFRYQATVYNGNCINTTIMTRKQAMEINYQTYDHVTSLDLGIVGFRTSDGQWHEFRNGDWPGIGDTSLRVIQAMQLNVNDLLTPKDIAEITGIESLRDSNVLSARLKAIRESHFESFKGGVNLFLSRKAGGYAIGWSPRKTWLWLERISPETNK